jgi:hypothetical protein
MAKKAKAKPKAKPTPAGEGRPVRAGTALAKIVACMIDGDRTLGEIAKCAGIRVDQARHRVKYVLRVNHGIGHKINGSGRVSIIFPRGFNRDNIIKEPGTK